ncbi:lipopolysaccharide biosynthesis protein, partial [Senegalimassilia anaerobia]|uniref:lipopolysaccharide biosynthesis protein n=1 Tax=Senegalimassilia anaerobia TaxID=1473216 RepID=UPI003A969269
GVYLYKAVDALADVYEGRLQQVDKLYLAGISQAFRSAAALIGFSLALLITRNVGVSSIVMAVIAALTFVVFTFPLAQLETPKSRSANAKRVIGLLKQCFPLFVALFMYNLIDNMPKFVMEGALSYDNQLYYNALYFPAHAILLTSGFIYKPMLLKMANAWADPAKRKKFDLIIVVMFVIIVAITVVMAGAMSWFGLAIMSFLYGIDFEQYRGLCFVMLAAGGVTAGIEFLYQVITVLRRQRAVTKLYLITFGFSLFVPVLLVNFTGLPGAVIGYLIVMCILLVLLVSEYASIRMDLHRKLTGKAAPDAEMPRAARTAAMAPVQVAGAQAAGVQAVAASVPQAVAAAQAQVQQAAAAQAAQATVVQQAGAPAEANAAVRGAHAPKAPLANAPVEASAAGNPTPDRSTAADNANRQASAPARLFVPEVYDTAPISWTAGGTVGIAQPEPEAPEPADEESKGSNA